jgi:superfamily II DNA helicase RecQ
MPSTSSTRDSPTSSTTLVSSSAPLSAPEPRQVKKMPSFINLASDDEGDGDNFGNDHGEGEEQFWNNVDEVSMDDYRTQLQLPIAPTRALTAEPLPPQNEEFPAPEPMSSPSTSTAATRADRDCYASPYYPEIIQKLKSTFKLHNFRPNQLKAITATMSGKDVFVLMPTGGGKSLCYQLPAICTTGKTKGVTFVISPLLALMNDQVRALKKLGINVVVFSSEQTADERRKARDSLSQRSGRKPSIVYITPEGVEKNTGLESIIQALYRNKELARFVIDEAHLISSWGREFRESVRVISNPPSH